MKKKPNILKIWYMKTFKGCLLVTGKQLKEMYLQWGKRVDFEKQVVDEYYYWIT